MSVEKDTPHPLPMPRLLWGGVLGQRSRGYSVMSNE